VSDLSILGRSNLIFDADMLNNELEMKEKISGKKILVIGAAGTIGQAVTKEIFKLEPRILHAVDLSENNLVELVRDIRSNRDYADVEFKTFAIDVGSNYYTDFYKYHSPYDIILNLSAMKHVRSERDNFTLMRMLDVNVFNSIKVMRLASEQATKKYFCVSTDKAANPVNLMGASKRIMELYSLRESCRLDISMARFANVAFSDGSLLHGFNQRLMKSQPISSPNDVKRYFVTPLEAGRLCLISTILGNNREIFFPNAESELRLQSFKDIAVRYLESRGYEPVECSTENEARARVEELKARKKWPVYFFESDTTGEKSEEEFFTKNETVNFGKFKSIGIIHNQEKVDIKALDFFENELRHIKSAPYLSKQRIVAAIAKLVPNMLHEEKGRDLDQRM
jgi:FlaA1/EpsC-like NDP-sugar epimerase